MQTQARARTHARMHTHIYKRTDTQITCYVSGSGQFKESVFDAFRVSFYRYAFGDSPTRLAYPRDTCSRYRRDHGEKRLPIPRPPRDLGVAGGSDVMHVADPERLQRKSRDADQQRMRGGDA